MLFEVRLNGLFEWLDWYHLITPALHWLTFWWYLFFLRASVRDHHWVNIIEIILVPTSLKQIFRHKWRWRTASKFKVTFFILEQALRLIERLFVSFDLQTSASFDQNRWFCALHLSLVLNQMIRKKILAVDEGQICVKVFRVYIKILTAFKLLHANWAILKLFNYYYYYIFWLVEPFIDTEVMEGVQARKHSAVVSIMQFFLANRATKFIKMIDFFLTFEGSFEHLWGILDQL